MYIVSTAADNPYPAVSHGQYILHDIITALLVFNHYRRHRRRIRISICHDRRHGKILFEKMDDPRMSGHINQPVHLNGTQLLQSRLQYGSVGLLVVEPGLLPSGIKTQVLHNCPVSLFFAERHNAFYHPGRTELRNILRNDSYRPGFLISQALGNIIGLVAPSFYNIKNLQPGFLAHLGLPIEYI